MNNSNWWGTFSQDYAGNLKELLQYLYNHGMEAELCLFEATVLEHINSQAWVGANYQYHYGETFLTVTDSELSDETYNYIDHIIEICSHSSEFAEDLGNWHLEIGNQINDPWERTNPPWMTSGIFLAWVDLVGKYLSVNTNHLVTNSSPSSGNHFAAATITVSRDFSWNVPVSFHGNRYDGHYYVADYKNRYAVFRNYYGLMDEGTPPATPYPSRPLVNNEPAKYCCCITPTTTATPQPCDQDSYDDRDLAHWSFWVSAMAGAYQYYHSQWAYNILYANDDGDDALAAFKSLIIANQDWYLMTPDFGDAIFLRNWNGSEFAGNLTAREIYPMVHWDGDLIDSAYIYILTEELIPTPLPTALCNQLVFNQLTSSSSPFVGKSFDENYLYEYHWYNPSTPIPTVIASATPTPFVTNALNFLKPIDPSTRFIDFPAEVKAWLNDPSRTGARDALLYIKRTEIAHEMQVENLTMELELNQSTFHPGDRFYLVLGRTNHNTYDVLGEQYLIIEVYGEYYFCPDWTPPPTFCDGSMIDADQSDQVTLFDFSWPEDQELENVTIWSGITDPGHNEAISTIESVTFNARSSRTGGLAYYVSGGAGDDATGDGSCRAPWKTIHYTLAHLPESGGETIRVIVDPDATPYPVTNSTPITVPAHVSLIGSGPEETTIMGDGSTGLITLLDHSKISGFSIIDCDLISEADVVITDNEFTGATQNTIIKCTNSQPGEPPDQVILNNLFVENDCSTVIYFSGNTAPKILGCTLANNDDACGIVCDSDAGVAAVIAHSIIAFNDTGIGLETGSENPDIYDNDIGENSTVDYEGLDAPTGNLSMDPLFVSGSYYLSQTTAGQAQDSPCVNAATTSTFPPFLIIGTTRTDGIMDRGAFDLGYHQRKMKQAIGFADLDGDYYTEGFLQFIDGAAPAEFVGLGSSEELEVYLNDGADNLTLSTQTFPSGTVAAAMGEFTGDGSKDLAAAFDHAVKLYANDGTAYFDLTQTISITPQVLAIDLQKLEPEGCLDLFIGTTGGTDIYGNDCEGEFTYDQHLTGADIAFLAGGDLDGDGDVDLVAANAAGTNQIWLNDESGDEIAGTKETLTVEDHGVVVRDLNDVAADTFGSIEITADYATTGVVLYTYHNANDTDHALYSVALQSTEELAADPQAPWYLSTTWSSDYTFGTIDSLSSLYLKNPSDDTVELTITYYYPDGTTADVDSSIEIDPHGVYAASMYWGMPSDAGSCEVEADGPLLGLTSRCYTNTTTGEKFMHAENLQHTEFAGSTMTTPYYLSYVDEDWYWESWFSVKNPWDDEVTATITYYDEDGDVVQSDNVALDAHSTTMYGIIEGDPSAVGSVAISASAVVLGHKEIFGADLTNEKLCIGSEPLDHPETGVLNYVVPWFESYETQDVWVGTWITFQNPNGATATIELTYYDADGEELSFSPAEIELEAHALQTIAPTDGDPDACGSIEIMSDLAVTGQIERFAIYSNTGDLEYGIDPVQKVK